MKCQAYRNSRWGIFPSKKFSYFSFSQRNHMLGTHQKHLPACGEIWKNSHLDNPLLSGVMHLFWGTVRYFKVYIAYSLKFRRLKVKVLIQVSNEYEQNLTDPNKKCNTSELPNTPARLTLHVPSSLKLTWTCWSKLFAWVLNSLHAR